MTDWEWEVEWRSPAQSPDIGDYIQIRIKHDYTVDIRVREGIVCYVDPDYIQLIPSLDKSNQWTVLAWRRRVVPMREEREERETVDA